MIRSWVWAVWVIAALAWGAPPRKRLDLQLHRADLRQVLRTLAEAGKVNLVIPDDLHGEVTVRLKDVPWDDALRAVLALRGLGFERFGNNLRVAPLRQLAGEAESRARVREAQARAEPLFTWFIPVTRGRAADLAPKVRAMLSPRGSMIVDERINVLVVTDDEAFVPPVGQ